MNYIDLLDDSDDDIPLLPSKNAVKRPSASLITDVGPPVAKKTVQEASIVELLSSDDDDLPVLLQNRNKQNLVSRPTSGYDSDKTEVYSNSDSLPDLDINNDGTNEPLEPHDDDIPLSPQHNQCHKPAALNMDDSLEEYKVTKTSGGCLSQSHGHKTTDSDFLGSKIHSNTQSGLIDKPYTAIKLPEVRLIL